MISIVMFSKNVTEIVLLAKQLYSLWNILFMAPIIKIDTAVVILTYFGVEFETEYEYKPQATTNA